MSFLVSGLPRWWRRKQPKRPIFVSGFVFGLFMVLFCLRSTIAAKYRLLAQIHAGCNSPVSREKALPFRGGHPAAADTCRSNKARSDLKNSHQDHHRVHIFFGISFFSCENFSTTPPRPFFSTLACRCTSSRVVPKLTGLSGCVSPVSFGAGVLGRPRRDAVSAADLFRARWRVVAFYLPPAWPFGWRSAPVRHAAAVPRDCAWCPGSARLGW